MNALRRKLRQYSAGTTFRVPRSTAAGQAHPEALAATVEYLQELGMEVEMADQPR
jgi:uncharacterized protein (DUF362 family)